MHRFDCKCFIHEVHQKIYFINVLIVGRYSLNTAAIIYIQLSNAGARNIAITINASLTLAHDEPCRANTKDTENGEASQRRRNARTETQGQW